MEQVVPEERPQKLVIITGFGPFIGHETVNASWEAVRLLPDTFSFKDSDYTLEKIQVPVEYEAVDKVVADAWERQPELVIHCGVHGQTNCIHVEKLAYNHKFTRPDYAGKRLTNASACLDCDGIDNDVIRCGLNLDKIVRSIEETCGCLPPAADGAESSAKLAKVSRKVGNYLCGYIYLKSLAVNRKRSLFVHVPPIDRPFSSEKTAEVILQIIGECVRQINEEMTDKC